MPSKPSLLHPVLAAKLSRVLAAMEALGYPMRIVSTVRTTEEQQALFAQGRTKPGPIVTNADGLTTKSNHQAKADGFGHAADCAFLDLRTANPTDVVWDNDLPWATYGACARAVGLRWGGDFKALLDRPHVELPPGT